MNTVANEVTVADAAPAATPPALAAAPPTSKVVFSDNFAGSTLGPDWAVLNPSPDNYAVDGGKLLIVTSAVTSLKAPKFLVLADSQVREITGETTFEVQSVTIEQ